MTEIPRLSGPDQQQPYPVAAAALRRRCADRGVLLVDLIGSPGAGKTSLLEATAPRLRGRVRFIALEGDPETSPDPVRLKAAGIPSLQITTGTACHLDVGQVDRALDSISDALLTGRMSGMPATSQPGFDELPFDIAFIENVGNLLCPALHDLGEHLRVVVLSTPEGHDKPTKYPDAFRTADILLVTKTDLLPHVDFDERAAAASAWQLNPTLEIIRISTRTGEGLEAWSELLLARLSGLRESEGAPPRCRLRDAAGDATFPASRERLD